MSGRESTDEDQIHRLLLEQSLAGRAHGETEPFRRWLVELEASACIAANVIIGSYGAFRSKEVLAAIRRFDRH